MRRESVEELGLTEEEREMLVSLRKRAERRTREEVELVFRR